MRAFLLRLSLLVDKNLPNSLEKFLLIQSDRCIRGVVALAILIDLISWYQLFILSLIVKHLYVLLVLIVCIRNEGA